jgi:hypothetical protein
MRHALLTMLMSMVPTLALASASGSGTGFACNMSALTADERTEHATLAHDLFAAAEQRKEFATGYAFRLPAERWADAARWAELERKCCPFFAFELNATADKGPVWLTVSGRSGAKAFMKQEFGL